MELTFLRRYRLLQHIRVKVKHMHTHTYTINLKHGLQAAQWRSRRSFVPSCVQFFKRRSRDAMVLIAGQHSCPQKFQFRQNCWVVILPRSFLFNSDKTIFHSKISANTDARTR